VAGGGGKAAKKYGTCRSLRQKVGLAKRNRLVAYLLMSMDAVFRALADRSRRRLLDRLRARNGQTLNELCSGLAMSRQAVTKHLNILEAANLVATEKRGREKLHYLNPVPIHGIAERWIGKFERGRLKALADLKKHLEEEK
jgi:DNA-binding transcriptional ArsR family regulator